MPLIKDLRHASHKMTFMYTYLKFQTLPWVILNEISLFKKYKTKS